MKPAKCGKQREIVPLWEGRFIKAVLIRYEDSSGVMREWEAVERVRAEGVVLAVPFTASGELLMIRQYRPALDSYIVELPAGLIDHGESAIEACRREIIEETGHVPDEIHPLVETCLSTGINTEPWSVFAATGARPASKILLASHQPDDNEDIEVMKIPLKDFWAAMEELEKRGERVDVRAFGLVELARRRLGLV